MDPADAATHPQGEQLARIDERQKFQDALDASLELSKARLSLLRRLATWKTGCKSCTQSKPRKSRKILRNLKTVEC